MTYLAFDIHDLTYSLELLSEIGWAETITAILQLKKLSCKEIKGLEGNYMAGDNFGIVHFTKDMKER